MKRSLFSNTRRILFIGLLFAPLSAFCWGVTGHRVVAEIAERHLSKKAKKGLKGLIGRENLAMWANWPDFIKSDTTGTWAMASKWHYVNIPGNLSKEVFVDSLRNLKGENLYTQIKAMTDQLKDESLTAEKRQIALRFLLHFVGDLHQPLHVGRAEDLGGNRINVSWFDKATNLHSVWDNSLVEFQQYSYTEYATVLDIVSEEQIAEWQNSALEDWFYDSYVLANKVYASVPADGKLGYKYNYIFQKDLDQQLLKGGVRLAKMLNEAFE
ncbi:MAG: S1/P1 nuclease [Chitinophagaceae bacterium]|nr:S1/P1 nuclease [Chitinophagaceae bacterium]